MAKKRNRKAEIYLTERALLDIAEIEAYSVEQFGRRVADRFESTDATFVLTLVHATMDIPSRLAELEPSLKAETESLHRKLPRKN